MTAARKLLKDLRETRLWPVAAALALALVAVPVLLSKRAPAVPVAPPSGAAAPAPAGGVPAVPAVNVETAPEHSRLPGRARDPFPQRSLGSSSASASATTATTVTGSGTGSSTARRSTSSSSGGSTTSSPPASIGTTTTRSTSTASPPLRYLLLSAALVIGREGGQPETLSDVERLTPLPSAKDAFLVFLGIKDDQNTAEFLVSSNAKPAGQGKCVPSPRQCQVLELRRGQHEAFLVVSSHGRVYEYTLRLKAIQLHATTSATVAQRAYLRESSAGARIVDRVRAHTVALRELAYSGHTGLLHDRPRSRSWLGQVMHLAGTLPG